MPNYELQLWWSSLTIAQKERIARKALSKDFPDGQVPDEQVLYPACTSWWNSVDEERRKAIHDHCTNDHGYLLTEWNDANPYGD